MKNNSTLSRRDFLKAAGISITAAACLGGCSLIRPAATGSPETWYADHQEAINKDIQNYLDNVRPFLVKDYGAGEAQTLLDETLKDFNTALGGLPYIGGYANSLTENLYLGAACLSFRKVLKGRDISAEQVGKYLYQGCVKMYASDPLIKIGGSMATGEEAQKKMRQMAEESQKRTYSADWVFEYIPGDGSFDYGINYTECGILKYYQSQGAEDFTPYLCLLDFPQSIALGTGLVRTTTLAHGGPCCDFRYQAGRDVQMEWAPDFINGGK